MSSKILDAVKKLKKDFFEVSDEVLAKELADRDAKLQSNAIVENTATSNQGKELVPQNQLLDMVEIIPSYFNWMQAFNNGFHGSNLGQSMKVPVVGEIGMALYNGETTSVSNSVYPADPITYVPTDEITITQQPLIMSAMISKREQNYSVADLEAYIKKEMARKAVRTIENMVLNGDTTTAAIGNINSVDGLPSTYLVGGANNATLRTDGLRKTFLSGTVNVDYKDVGTLDFDDFLSVRGLLGDWSYDLSNMVLLMNGNTYTKALMITEFQQYNMSGKVQNVINDGAVANIAGVPMYVARDYPLTQADGTMSHTAASNTLGGFLYATKNAVQWGFGQAMEVDAIKIPGKGLIIIATMEFGFAILNKKAGATSPFVVGAINVTV